MHSFSFISTMGNPITLLFLFFFVFFIFLGTFIYSKDTRLIENKLFFILCISFSFVCFGEMFFSWSHFEEDAFFFHAVSSIGFFSFWPIILNFFLVLKHKKLGKLWCAFLIVSYIIAFAFICSVFAGINVSKAYIRDTFTWIDVTKESFWWSKVYLPFILPTWVFLIFYTNFSIRNTAKRTGNIIRQKQFNIIIYSGIITFVYGMFFNIIAPLINIKVPSVGLLSSGFWIIFVAYAITKYKFLVPTLEHAAKQIFDIGGEMNIVADLNFNITDPNIATIKKLNYSSKEQMRGVNFNDLLFDKKKIMSLSDFKEKENTEIETSIINNEEERIYVNLKASFIYSNENKIGILFVLSDVTALNRLVQERTKEIVAIKEEVERQLEINRIYAGSVVAEISKKTDPRKIEPTDVNRAIIFTDIRRFTSITEGLTPLQTVNFLNAFHQNIGSCVKQTDNDNFVSGEINKFIGDSMMVLYENPDSAIYSAIAMRNIVSELNFTHSIHLENLEIGIGIDWGRVTQANMGIEQEKIELTVIGDPVNRASRLESLTKFYGAPILISGELKSESKKTFNTRFVDEVCFYGKNNPTKIFEVLDARQDKYIEMILKNQEKYDEARDYYCEGKFEESLKIYLYLSKLGINDKVLNVYSERIINLLEKKQSSYLSDWNGVYRFSEK